MTPARTARLLLALTGAGCLVGAAISVDRTPRVGRPEPPDWLERYRKLEGTLPTRGDLDYLNDPAADPGDRTAYFRAQYVATPAVLHFQTDPETLFRRHRFRPVLIDFASPPDRRVALTISRVRQAAAAAGFETEVHKLGGSLFLIRRR
jgi:hypothetical protein